MPLFELPFLCPLPHQTARQCIWKIKKKDRIYSEKSDIIFTEQIVSELCPRVEKNEGKEKDDQKLCVKEGGGSKSDTVSSANFGKVQKQFGQSSRSLNSTAIARQTEVRQKTTCPLFFFRTIESINAFGWLVVGTDSSSKLLSTKLVCDQCPIRFAFPIF